MNRMGDWQIRSVSGRLTRVIQKSWHKWGEGTSALESYSYKGKEASCTYDMSGICHTVIN